MKVGLEGGECLHTINASELREVEHGGGKEGWRQSSGTNGCSKLAGRVGR